jgi:ribose transport system ATP-binding protein
MRCITGADPYDSGEILIHGKGKKIHHPKSSIENGIAFLTEDRKHQGLGMNLSIKTNTNLASYKKISQFGVVSLHKETERAEHFRKEIRIKTPSISQIVRNLSGGNQQKVVVAKWLACDSDIFIFDEPTVGVDVGAKVEIYHLIEDLLKRGAAVIIVSSYLPEVMGLSDRILVMAEGRKTGIIDRSEFSEQGRMNEELLVRLASGIT